MKASNFKFDSRQKGSGNFEGCYISIFFDEENTRLEVITESKPDGFGDEVYKDSVVFDDKYMFCQETELELEKSFIAELRTDGELIATPTFNDF